VLPCGGHLMCVVTPEYVLFYHDIEGLNLLGACKCGFPHSIHTQLNAITRGRSGQRAGRKECG